MSGYWFYVVLKRKTNILGKYDSLRENDFLKNYIVMENDVLHRTGNAIKAPVVAADFGKFDSTVG